MNRKKFGTFAWIFDKFILAKWALMGYHRHIVVESGGKMHPKTTKWRFLKRVAQRKETGQRVEEFKRKILSQR
jgi:hypothetical protein